MFLSKTIYKKTTLLILLMLGIWVGSAPALADTIEFGDGNILHGTVSSLEKGTLTFSTEYAEKIQIPVEKIKTVSSEKAVTIKMVNDSILTGKLTTLEDGRVAVILEPVGETVPFQWDQVKTINEPPSTWGGHIALGGNVKSGNTKSTNVSLSFNAKREWEHDRFQLRFLYNYEEDSNTLTARDTFGSMKFDHFFTENFFNALSMEFLQDEFKDLNLRFILGLGLGYRLWNDDVKTLELEAGIAYFSENLDQGQDDQFMSGRFGLTLSYKIFENLSLKNYLLYYPSLEEPKEYKLRNEASIVSQLGVGWSVKVTHILDQDSLVDPGIEKTDNQFIFAIQYSF